MVDIRVVVCGYFRNVRGKFNERTASNSAAMDNEAHRRGWPTLRSRG